MHKFAWYATTHLCVHRPRAQHWQSIAAPALWHIMCLADESLSGSTLTSHSHTPFSVFHHALQDDKAFHITADIPGVDKDRVDVSSPLELLCVAIHSAEAPHACSTDLEADMPPQAALQLKIVQHAALIWP